MPNGSGRPGLAMDCQDWQAWRDAVRLMRCDAHLIASNRTCILLLSRRGRCCEALNAFAAHESAGLPIRKLLRFIITTAGSLARRGVFFVKLSLAPNVRPFDREKNTSNFQIARAFSGERGLWCGEGRGSRFSWLTRWRPSVAEPGAHALAWLLALARHRHRSASVGRRPHGCSTRLAACLLGRDQ